MVNYGLDVSAVFKNFHMLEDGNTEAGFTDKRYAKLMKFLQDDEQDAIKNYSLKDLNDFLYIVGDFTDMVISREHKVEKLFGDVERCKGKIKRRTWF